MFYNRFILTLFTLFSCLLIVYGFYIDITNKDVLTFYDSIGLGLSLSSSLLGIVFVVLEVQEKALMFVVSIIASLLTLVYLFFWSPLLWDVTLYLGYLFISIYALYYWLYPKKDEQDKRDPSIPKTQILSLKGWVLLILVNIAGTGLLSVLGIYFGRYSSSFQAILDAFTTSTALIGQVLLARKYLESWYMWILANIVSIPLYITIHSYTYSALYFCYLCVSFYGLYVWKRRMN